VFDQWCLRHSLCISWRAHITNEEVCQRTDQPPLTHIICTTRLTFLGHIARANPSMDHSQALRACVAPLPRKWNRRSGRPHHTWLQTVESDLAHSTLVWNRLLSSAESSSMEHAHRNGSSRSSYAGHSCYLRPQRTPLLKGRQRSEKSPCTVEGWSRGLSNGQSVTVNFVGNGRRRYWHLGLLHFHLIIYENVSDSLYFCHTDMLDITRFVTVLR